MVRFVWVTDQHNIAIDDQPDESDWEDHEPIEDAGFEHEHTFGVEGNYEFHCTPHVSLGVVGTIVVGEGGGATGPVDLVPEEETTLVVATVASLFAVLALAYAFLKYGAGASRRRRPARSSRQAQ